MVRTGDLYLDILKRLTRETQETSHASLLAGYQIATIAACEGLHNNRVVHEAGGRLEPHATASGIACLAYAGSEFQERALARPLTAFADNTPMTPDDLLAALARTRSCGYGTAPGTFTGGRIVNVASMAGMKVLSQIGVYCMSKAAVIHMTRAMALEWGRWGINVNAICPGYIDTEINHHHWQTEQGKKLVDMLPRKRVGQPQDLDTTLLMLVANESHFINGAVIQADDGFAV